MAVRANRAAVAGLGALRRALGCSRTLVLAAAVAALALAMAGCTSGSPSAASSAGAVAANAADGPAASETAARSAEAPSSAAGSASAAPSRAAGSGSPDPAAGAKKPRVDAAAAVVGENRQVIRTATLTVAISVHTTGKGTDADAALLSGAMTEAAVKVRSLVGARGFVGAADGGGNVMAITLRVPVGGYDGVLSALAGIGAVTDRKESTEDVSAQLIDLGSRVETMKVSVGRIRSLLSKADKIGDVISIESELAAREADLESLQRQQAGLAGQTALSTVTVILKGSIGGILPAAVVAPPAARSGFLGGLANGWDAVRKVLHVGATVVGTVLPFLPIVAVLVIGGLIWRRRFVGRTGAGRPALAGPGEPQPAGGPGA